MTTVAGDARYFELSPTDRAMTLLAERASFAPYLALELDAPLDAARLRRALALLARRHPILGATVDASDTRGRWLPATTAPELVDVPGAAPDAASALAASLDAHRAPVCRVVNVRSPEAPHLMLGAHHALADGRALVVLLDDLRRLYLALGSSDRRLPAGSLRSAVSVSDHGSTPLTVDVDWSPRSIGAGLDARGVGAETRLRLAWETAERWRRAGRSTHVDASAEPSARLTPELVDIPTRFDPLVVAAIDRAARARGWRQNHVVLALAARAWDEVVGRDPAPCPNGEPARPAVSGWLVTVDTRRQLDLARGIGNLSGFEPVALADIGSVDLLQAIEMVRAGFEPLARFGAGMVAELVVPSTPPVAGRAVDLVLREALAFRSATSRYTRCYSNVGALPDELGDWGESQARGARWVPGGIVTPSFLAMIVVTFRGATTITYVTSTATMPHATAIALAARVRDGVDELLALTAEPVPG